MAEEKPVVMTVIVYPLKQGKKRVTVSGAPEGEMPIVHAGLFADVHNLINATWAELIRRKPQVPRNIQTVKAESTPAETAGAGDDLPQETAAAEPAPVPPPDLPAIEGDQMVASDAAGAEPVPALSSLDDTNEVSNG